MEKIRKSWKAIRMILGNPRLLNLVLDDNENWKSYIAKKYAGQTTLNKISFVDIFGEFEGIVSPYTFLDGGSMVTDLLLLRKLASRFEDCSYFEIGTWRGESVANVAQVAKECFTVDLPDTDKKRIGMTKEYIEQHGILSKSFKNVTHLKENSMHFEFGTLNRKFDLVFIDGDHHYNSIMNDSSEVMKYLCHDNTIIVWHDACYNPEKPRHEVIAAILDSTPTRMHDNIFHVENSLCAVYLPGFSSKTASVQSSFELNVKVSRK
ncbi:MAG: class I SAM-dependent methyltransferase [Bacteroidales bacterium]|nr:class I SAM-dependent methyltransferase [Bacteroidales bacterium]